MKFLAVLSDIGATDAFAKIAETVSHLCKDRVALHITNDALTFINADAVHTTGTFMQISLLSNEFFSSFTMAGMSEEFNEIYLEMDKDYLSRGLNPKEQATKIRLTKIGNVPHIKVEQKTCAVVHEMPVIVVPTRQWKSLECPSTRGVKVALRLPSLTTLRNLLASLRNMGNKHLIIRGNRKGELFFSGEMDSARVEIHFSDLETCRIDDPDGADDDPSTLHEVRVDVKGVNTLFRNLNTNFSLARFIIQIVPDKMAIFSGEQDDSKMIYIVGGVAV